jgi:hypothetical protein
MNSITTYNALLALSFLCLSLAASAQPTAPSSHAATGMTFPTKINDHATLIRSVDRGKTDNQPELGFTWYYHVEKPLDGMVAIYVYNAGQTEIPTGANSPFAASEFEEAITATTQMFLRSRPLKTVKGPAECTVAGLTFRCVTFLDVLPNGVPAYTMLLLTGYRNHLVFVSAEWNGKAAELPEAEKYLNGMLTTLMR